MKKILDKYFNKTKGFYPFFKYCPKMYQNYYFNRWAGDLLGYDYNWLEPNTYNEKMKWLIHNERLKSKSLLTDKIKVKAYVTALLGEGHCAPLYGMWKDFDDIDFSYLPNRFVLKTSHLRRTNIFVTNKNFIKANRKSIKKLTNDWLKIKFEQVSLEPQYSSIKPMLFAELFGPTENVFRLNYQVHCINEIPFMIEVVSVKGRNGCCQFYDTDWNLLPYRYKLGYYKTKEEKPEFLNEMIEYARILSKGFSFVRIDFAPGSNNCYVVEMNFSPDFGIMPFNDRAYDYELGSILKLPFEIKGSSSGKRTNESCVSGVA